MRQLAGIDALLHGLRARQRRLRRDGHERMHRRFLFLDARKAGARRIDRADLARLYLCAQLKGGQIK